MSKVRGKNTKSSKRGNNTSRSVDQLIVSSHHASGGAMVNMPRSDLVSRVPSWNLTQKPPLNYMTQIHWIQSSYTALVNVSNSGITESNLSFNLSALNSGSNLASLFDTYCIYSAHVRYTLLSEYSSTGSYGYINTAIDYDNVNSLGSLPALQDYSSIQQTILDPQISAERFIKPCVSPAIYNASSSAFSGFGTSRMWVDCANPSIPHYGLRLICNGNSISGVQVLGFITLTLGFRNNI